MTNPPFSIAFHACGCIVCNNRDSCWNNGITNDSAAAAKAFLRALDGNRNSLVAHIELVDLLLAQNRVQQAQRLYDETLILVQGQGISPRLLLQGIKLAEAQGDSNQRQQLSRQLLSAYPLSDEAKQLKTWLNNPEAPWQ